jgi:hypothetical protein
MVEENWLEDFLAEFEYKITVDNIVIFEWQTLAPKVSADRLKNGEEIKLKDERGLTNGVCKVRFEKGALYIEFIDDIMLEKTTSAFKVKETSFLRYDENYYYWSIRHPTRNLTCTATLGRGLKKS